jgi:hypothetical protein
MGFSEFALLTVLHNYRFNGLEKRTSASIIYDVIESLSFNDIFQVPRHLLMGTTENFN